MNIHLLQLSDSALPISGYTHSWGLEAAIARGLVHDPETLETWTARWLRSSLGPLEGVMVAASCRAIHAGEVQTLTRLNELVEVSMVPPTIRRASREMGEQLLVLGGTWDWSGPKIAPFLQGTTKPWHHCVVFGLLGAVAQADSESVLTAYLHQAALGLVSSGVRAIPVGHTHGQQVLAYLHRDILGMVRELVQRSPEAAGAGCPFYEVLCDEQTRLYARMFRS
jgi:urease accessory protein